MGEAAGSLAPLTALAQPRADHDSSHASDERPERGPPPPRKIDSMNRIIARLLPRLGLALCATLTLTPFAQERDRTKIADRYKWNLADIYPTDAAWRAAKDTLAAELPQLAQFQGKLASSASTLADALDKQYGARQGTVAALRLCQHAGRPGHARLAAPGHAAGDGAARRPRSAPQASYIEPETPQGRQGRRCEQVSGVGAAAQGLSRSISRTSSAAPRTRSATPKRSCSPTPARVAGSPSSVFNILSNADFPYPIRDAERRPDGQARPGGLRGLAGAAQSRGPREGDVGVLRSAGRLQPDLRHDDERRGAEGAVLSPRRGNIRRRSKRRSTVRTSRSPVYTRLIEGVNKQPAGVPSLSQAAKADDGARRAALLRSLCAARRLGRSSKYTPEEAQTARARRGGAARRRLSGDDPQARSRSAGSICSRTKASGPAPTRTAAPTTSTRTC